MTKTTDYNHWMIKWLDNCIQWFLISVFQFVVEWSWIRQKFFYSIFVWTQYVVLSNCMKIFWKIAAWIKNKKHIFQSTFCYTMFCSHSCKDVFKSKSLTVFSSIDRVSCFHHQRKIYPNLSFANQNLLFRIKYIC